MQFYNCLFLCSLAKVFLCNDFYIHLIIWFLVHSVANRIYAEFMALCTRKSCPFFGLFYPSKYLSEWEQNQAPCDGVHALAIPVFFLQLVLYWYKHFCINYFQLTYFQFLGMLIYRNIVQSFSFVLLQK